MQRTATATPQAGPVHEPHAPRPSTIDEQIAVSVQQRQVTRQILAESRRLSELTRHLLAHPPRGAQANHNS